MGSQGYEIKQNILFQDKQSSMKTKNLGKKLYTGKSKHIDIHYLFSKYRVESKKCQFVYCSIEKMLAYLFTRSLQRALFAKCCDAIMGLTHVYTLYMVPPSTKEHVGNLVKVGPNKEGI